MVLATSARAETIKIPELTRPFIDETGLVSAPDAKALEDMLLKLDHSGKTQLVIYIPQSLQELDIASFSLAAAEKWKLGGKGKDQGLLLVVAPNERKMRLEVGYGLEGDFTDAYSRRLLDNTLAPYFRERRFGDGFMVAVEQIAAKLNVDLKAPVASRISEGRDRKVSFPGLFMLLFFFFFIIVSLFRSHGGRYGGGGYGGFGGGGGGGGSFGGGGGFSGGGGGFGGGGASSSW